MRLQFVVAHFIYENGGVKQVGEATMKYSQSFGADDFLRPCNLPTETDVGTHAISGWACDFSVVFSQTAWDYRTRSPSSSWTSTRT